MYAAVSAARLSSSTVVTPCSLVSFTEASGIHLIDTRNDFLGDGNRVDVIWVKTITKSTDACGNLTKHINNTLTTTFEEKGIPYQTELVPSDRLSKIPSAFPLSHCRTTLP